MTGNHFSRTPRFWTLLRRALALAVMALAGAAMTAWLIHSQLLDATASDFGLMVFNAAACLALLSGGVLLLNGARAWHRNTTFLLGTAVVALATITLVEHLTGSNLGIDQPNLHRWLQVRTPTPGRMAVGTSFAMLFLGIALCLWRYAARRGLGLLIQSLVVFAAMIAVFGIIIREMQLQFLYTPHMFSGMALHTSFGIAALSIGIWIAWHPTPWNRLLTSGNDEQRIKSSGTAILLTIAIGAGFFGFYASQDTMEKIIIDSHMQTLRARIRQIETVLEHRLIQSGAISTRLDLQERLYQINRNPDDVRAKQQLNVIAESWLPLGYGGVAFYDSTRHEVARAGKFVEQAMHALPLGAQNRVRLSWSNGFHMRTEIAMFHDNQPVGKVVAELFLSHLTEALLDTKDFGDTGDIELCALVKGRASCFPTRLNAKPFIYPPASTYQPYPIYRALGGQANHEYGLDYRGTPVFAAFAPIADYGLGMVMKVNVTELTAPVRRELERLLPIVLLLVIAGIALLNYLVHPLARKLAANERQLKLALDNSSLALWDWDTRSNMVYLSEQWQAILGGKPAATTTTFSALQNLVHPDDAEALAKALRDTLKNGTSYVVEHRVRTYSGDWKWIRSTGNVVERNASGRVLRMNGTNADITLRKRDEDALAHRAQHDGLTGLPNRSLFHDRLERATTRAQRDKQLIAVMYLDIDKFKNINDTLGHAMGDELLKSFARRLEVCVRSVDTVARLGGDEFAIVLEQLSDQDAGRRIAEKIVTSMRPEFTLEYHTLAITTSVGVAFYRGGEEIKSDDLVKKADQALYAAKGAGRNNYQVAA